jgi:L-threonylcarbamoyladenylate synthase
MTKIVKIDFYDSDSALKKAAGLLREGKIIIYPTDTLYGIGAGIYHEAAIEKLFEIKKRESEKPVLILVEKPEDIFPLVKNVSSAAAKLIKQYWPGPVTFVFEVSEKISTRLTAHSGKIGIRCPGSPLVRRLLFFAGFPVTATSANLSAGSPCRNAREAEKVFGKQVDLILDGGVLESEPSTVVDVTGEEMKILRPGKIVPAECGTGCPLLENLY